MSSDVIGRIAGLPELCATDLKKLWKDLYGKEPPPFNKVYFVKRLAYRLQELAYGVDSQALERRLELHARQYMDVRGKVTRKAVDADRPITGTRLMREYQGEEHHVTVLHDCYEYRGKRYRSLMADIQADKIDVVVVYKIDRLTRSLLDFAQMIEIFEKHNVSFVSVTQQFSTTTSMGRLMLNVLLSFAQFEREVTGERIRDKLAASKRKGMWMGGVPPLGYDVKDRRLVINEAEAAMVRQIFNGFTEMRSITAVVKKTHDKGFRTKTYVSQKGNARQGKLMDKGYIYKLINNPIYIGKIVHKDETYPGLHQAIIDQSLWDQAHQIMKINPRTRANENRRKYGAALRGIIKCGGCNSGMIPTSTRRRGKLYRYYTPNAHMKKSCGDCPVGNVSAGDIENVVLTQLQGMLQTPEIIAQVWVAAKAADPAFTEKDAHKRLSNILELWDQLFPAEQQRVMRQVVQEVVVKSDGLEIVLNQNGLGDFAKSICVPDNSMKVAS